jgi:ADP-ribosyl-[dinitrogen reductase] hydrolase
MTTLDRLEGVLLGTALGDALGLPWEGMGQRTIARRIGSDSTRLHRFRLLGPWGFVSDDTEQSALVAQALARGGDDVAVIRKALRRSLCGWFLRLPWGIGLATLRSCVKLCFGIQQSGVPSAGNGAAMRMAVVGVHFVDNPTQRRETVRALAEITHTDPRGVEGALFVAELAAAMAQDKTRSAGTVREAL